jgi:hypothetical protein
MKAIFDGALIKGAALRTVPLVLAGFDKKGGFWVWLVFLKFSAWCL